MPEKYGIFPGVVFELFWSDGWRQPSNMTTPRFTLFDLLVSLILLLCLLSCQLINSLLSTFRMVRAAHMIKLAVLTVEELFFIHLPPETFDGNLRSSRLETTPKDETAYPKHTTYQNITKPSWFTDNGKFILRYYGPKIDLSTYTGTDEEPSEYNSSTHRYRQSTKYGGVSQIERDPTLQNLPAGESSKKFDTSNDDEEKCEDPLQYKCQKESFDRTSHLLWNQNKPTEVTVSPVIPKADVHSIKTSVTAVEQCSNLVIKDATQASEKDFSIENTPDRKYQQHSNTSPEMPRINTYPFSDANSPRGKSLHDRNHFRRRRASPIPVTELVKKATELKMFEFRDFIPESAAPRQNVTGESLDENIEKLSVSFSPLPEVFREAPERDDFVTDVLNGYVDSIHPNSASRSGSTSTDEDDFDNRFRILNPHMPCPGLFPGPGLMHKRSTSSDSIVSEIKPSSSNGSPPRRIRFAEGSEDRGKESNDPERYVFKAETAPLFELPAYEITDSKEQSSAAQGTINTDSIFQKDITKTAPCQTDFTFPPLPPDPYREIKSSTHHFEIYQDESGQRADEESTQVLPLIAPMKSKIPVTRKSLKTKSPVTRGSSILESQDRPLKHASSKSSPLRQPPLTLRSLNHHSPESEADGSNATTGMSLSQDEWPSLPRQKADGELPKTLGPKTSKFNIRQPVFVCPGASKRDVEDDNEGPENTSFVSQTPPTKPGRIELYQAFFGDDPDDSTQYVFD